MPVQVESKTNHPNVKICNYSIGLYVINLSTEVCTKIRIATLDRISPLHNDLDSEMNEMNDALRTTIIIAKLSSLLFVFQP